MGLALGVHFMSHGFYNLPNIINSNSLDSLVRPQQNMENVGRAPQFLQTNNAPAAIVDRVFGHTHGWVPL